MTTKITLPQLGESIHEGTIGKWLKQVGEQVEEYEPIVEIITDNVNAEVPAPVKGTLSAILVPEGETVAVGMIIGEMLEVAVNAATEPKNGLGAIITGESEHQQPEQANPTAQVEGAFALSGASPATPVSQVEEPLEQVEASFPNGKASGGWYDGEEEEATSLVTTPAVASASTQPGKPHRYSPAVRRLAEEHQLDLERLALRGTGLGGRITRDDVLMYVEGQRRLQQPVPTRALPGIEVGSVGRREMVMTPPLPVTPMHEQIAANALRQPASAPSAVPSQPTAQLLPTPDLATPTPDFLDQIVPLTPMRRAIAEHMVRSVQTAPHAWTMVEVDLTRLVRYRAGIKEDFKRREGVDLTYLPFVIKAVIEGLRQFPQMNASWAADGSGVIIKHELNLGVAIDVPDGLVVPVISRADEKSLVGLARSLHDLVSRARARKLNLADVQGGTFTVNNPGAFGSVLSQPILNQPQAGIVTMEAIVKRPVVVTDPDGDERVVVRSMMNMCLSFDHRVVDGATAGRFLQAVKKWLETRSVVAGF